MNTNKIILLFLLLFNVVKGQEQIRDTVYVSTKKVTHLVSEKFEHVMFSDESILGLPEKIAFEEKNLILLRPKKSFNKSLIISLINEDGFYEITCIYDDAKALSFHSLKKDVINSNNTNYNLPLNYIKNLKGWSIKRVGASDGTFTAKLNSTYIYNEKLFVKIELINSSNLNFDIDSYEFYIDMINVTESESYHINKIIPIGESDKNVKRIAPNSSIFKVFAFNEISIGSNKHFKLTITEKSSERTISLLINARFIEQARKLKSLR